METKATGLEGKPFPMGWVWMGVFGAVVVVLGIADPFSAVRHLLENQGIGEEGASVLGFVAGYTLPLTVGFFLIGILFLNDAHKGHPVQEVVGTVGLIFFASGLIASYLGLGLLPNFAVADVSGPAWVQLPVRALIGYASTYTLPLFVSAFLIGSAFAAQVRNWQLRAENA